MNTNPSPPSHLALIADLLHALGYRGSVDEEHGIVATAAGGLSSTITSCAGSDIQLRCLVVDLESVSPIALNDFNQRYRFAKTYVDEVGDVFLEADFLFDEGAPDARDKLHDIMKLWENFVSGFRDMLVSANGQAERAPSTASN